MHSNFSDSVDTVRYNLKQNKIWGQMNYFAGPETAAPNDQTFAKVIVPTAFALLLCNMDRIVMSVAILPIAKEFNWAPSMQVCSAPFPGKASLIHGLANWMH